MKEHLIVEYKIIGVLLKRQYLQHYARECPETGVVF